MAVTCLLLPSFSSAQTTFYTDASCTTLCLIDGSNCNGVAFTFNPTPVTLATAACYKAKTSLGSSKAVRPASSCCAQLKAAEAMR